MSRLVDLTGKVFERLTVIKRMPNRDRHTMWLCKCECEKETVVDGYHLKCGYTRSCGCLRSEPNITRNTTYSSPEIKLYRRWSSMKARCYNKNSKCYSRYGGRGITVCDEWRNSFEAFRDWALSNGYSDDLTIDRIENNGNYEPSNCRWTDVETQANNKRCNRLITYNNKTHTIAQWSNITGIPYDRIRRRMDNGWTPERTLTTKVRHCKKRAI